jgi:hypothetical protein
LAFAFAWRRIGAIGAYEKQRVLAVTRRRIWFLLTFTALPQEHRWVIGKKVISFVFKGKKWKGRISGALKSLGSASVGGKVRSTTPSKR